MILSILLAALPSQRGRQGHYGARMYKAICGLTSLCTRPWETIGNTAVKIMEQIFLVT